MKIASITHLPIIITIFVFSLSTFNINAKIRNFETTRMKSTAGAGVGAILMEEASILNPAPVAFYNISSIYIQKTDGNISQNTPDNPHSAPLEANQLGFIFTESNNKVSGSASYQKTEDRFSKRDRFAFATATRLKDKTAIGGAVRFSMEQQSVDGINKQKVKYNQLIAGLTHVINPEISFGLIVIDPLKKIPEETRALIGLQYVYENVLAFMVDAGSDYNKDLSETLTYKTAIQVRILNDFFARVGIFNDKGIGEKGNGIGVSWVQPKLLIEAAFKNTVVMEDLSKNTVGEEIKETSISLSYRF